jgi:hypothetical protein
MSISFDKRNVSSSKYDTLLSKSKELVFVSLLLDIVIEFVLLIDESFVSSVSRVNFVSKQHDDSEMCFLILFGEHSDM